MEDRRTGAVATALPFLRATEEAEAADNGRLLEVRAGVGERGARGSVTSEISIFRGDN